MLSNLVKLVMGPTILCLMSEAKNWVFEFNHLQMNMSKFIQSSINDVQVCSMFNQMVFDSSLLIQYWKAWLNCFKSDSKKVQTTSDSAFPFIFNREALCRKHELKNGIHVWPNGISLQLIFDGSAFSIHSWSVAQHIQINLLHQGERYLGVLQYS